MTNKVYIFVFDDGGDPERFASDCVRAVDRDSLTRIAAQGGEWPDPDSGPTSFDAVKFEHEDDFILTLRTPPSSSDNKYAGVLISINPFSIIKDSNIQSLFVDIMRDLGRVVSPPMAYVGEMEPVIDPETIHRNPNLGFVTYFNNEVFSQFDSDPDQCPGCKIETIGDGVLIVPPGDFISSVSDRREAASYLGTGLIGIPE
jgi:hypothetical protein